MTPASETPHARSALGPPQRSVLVGTGTIGEPLIGLLCNFKAQLGIDERVRMLEEKAPGNDAARTAVLEFFDCFARSDDQALGSMLSGLDHARCCTEIHHSVVGVATRELTATVTAMARDEDLRRVSDPPAVFGQCEATL